MKQRKEKAMSEMKKHWLEKANGSCLAGKVMLGGNDDVNNVEGALFCLLEAVENIARAMEEDDAPGVALEDGADYMCPAHVIRILLSEAHDRWGDCLEVPRSDLVAWLSSRITQWSASAVRGGPAMNTQETGYLAHMTWERTAGAENECDAERRIRESTKHSVYWWHGWLARSDEWRAEIGHGSDHGETDDK
jgi:hypothetical protein